MHKYNERVWNAQHNGFAFLSFVHNSGNYAFIVSHDFQAEKIAAAAARRRQVLFFGGFVYLVSLQYSGPTGLG